MAEQTKAQVTRRGEASSRIINMLAADFPRLHTRATLLESLDREDAPKKGGRQTAKERAAAKTLGRLISAGAVSEFLYVQGEDEKVNLPHAGMIAASVDLLSLQKAWVEWKNGAPGAEPRQESMVEAIIKESGKWIEKNKNEDNIPICLTNISIIHGSDKFDLLVTCIYRDPKDFLRYTREVIQRVDHVESTHTMLIAQAYGFPWLRARQNAC